MRVAKGGALVVKPASTGRSANKFGARRMTENTVWWDNTPRCRGAFRALWTDSEAHTEAGQIRDLFGGQTLTTASRHGRHRVPPPLHPPLLRLPTTDDRASRPITIINCPSSPIRRNIAAASRSPQLRETPRPSASYAGETKNLSHDLNYLLPNQADADALSVNTFKGRRRDLFACRALADDAGRCLRTLIKTTSMEVGKRLQL